MKRKPKKPYKSFLRKIFYSFFLVFLLGFCLPQNLVMPVEGATKSDYNPDSFWYYPWGKSGTHKGIDVFAKEGKNVVSSTYGIVIFNGSVGMGGNVILILGPKWRFHYYAHLKEIKTHFLELVKTSSKIGSVGTTGNAAGKAPHLHYAIKTMIPYPWRVDNDPQGYKKMFYLNPIDYLEN